MDLQNTDWLTEIGQKLTETIRTRPGLAAFDFDNTVIKNDLGEAIMQGLLQNGLVHLKEDFASFFPNQQQAREIFKQKQENTSLFANYVWQEYERIRKEKGLEAGYRWSSFLFSGMTEAELKDFSRRIWLKANQQQEIYPYPAIMSLFALLKQNNWQIKIITASPQICIQSAAAEIGISTEHIIGMQLELDQNYFSSQIIEPYTYGSGKVKRLQQLYQKNADLAFGDSINDFPLLQSAKLGVLLDRGKDDDLVARCQQENILVQPVFP